MRLTLRKDKDGKRLLDKFSVPRNPTRADPRRRIRPEDDPEDFARLVAYNIRDIETEAEASHRLPDLSEREQEVWFLDHDINSRGIAIDQDGMADCIAVIEQAFERYNSELQAMAGCNASETARLRLWLLSCGVDMESLDEEHVETTLAAMGRPEWVRERVEELGEPEYRRRTYEAWARLQEGSECTR
jgi:DNA polymerase